MKPLRTAERLGRIVTSSVTWIFAAALLLALCAPLGSLQAQGWPSRPVKLIVPFAPGGTADLFGRIAAEELGKSFNQQFIVENRGGAGGLVGSAAVAAAEPDGYTLLISGIPTLVVAPIASATPPFDPIRDFTHIAYLGGVPLVLLANPALGVQTYSEFVTRAKLSEKPLGYVTPGAGTHAHLFGDYLGRKEGVKLEHIPYKGANPAMTDLLAGHVPLGVMSWSASLQQIRAGKVNALAVSSMARLPEQPSVLTFRELGYDDLVAATWFSLSGPANLPVKITEEINLALLTAFQATAVQNRLAQEAVEIRQFSPHEFTSFVKAEIARWRPIIKAMSLIEN